MKAPLNKRKYTRLKNREIYSQVGVIAHVIIGTFDKRPYFEQRELAQRLCQVLIETAKENRIKIYAYCIMPDHVHLLFESSESMGVIEFVRYIKGRFATWCRKNNRNMRLQKSFYDHLLRKEEDVYSAAKYIMGNPVRAGIETRVGNYPFAGSLVFDFSGGM